LIVARFELLHTSRERALATTIAADMRSVSPETEVRTHVVDFGDPWDFGMVYEKLHEFAEAYPFDPEHEEYLVHVTTGTHVAQICLFLLTETRYIPARLIQTAPPRRHEPGKPGWFDIIDLDLSKYDRLAARVQQQRREDLSFLKAGIDTRSRVFNELVARIEQVAIASRSPLLLSGPTGAGKSRLARRIYELKKNRQRVTGAFVEVNCATIRGDAAASTLFGHVRGSPPRPASPARGCR
jgi:transcriptional regulatory protein RtcR